MKARGGDPRLAQTFTLSAVASLGERAIEAAVLRREIAAMTASGAGDTYQRRVARRSRLSQDVVQLVFEALASTMSTQLKKGDRIALVGFGSFSVSARAARTGRNPQTGKEIRIAAKNVVRFTAGADLSKKVN